MYKNVFAAFSFAAMMLMAVSLSGCSGASKASENAADSKPAIAYVIQNSANAKPLDLNAPIVKDTITDCAEKYGYVFVSRVDGESELVVSQDLDIDERFKSASKERLKMDAYKRASDVLDSIGTVKAKYAELDFLEGIRGAAASLNSLDESYTSKSIVICGTGLQTTGYLDFRNNIIYAAPEAVVDSLVEREALPDLNGMTVYWSGMGQVAEPQEKLSQRQLKKLESIWGAIIEASGGEFMPSTSIAVATDEEPAKDLPAVSIVSLPAEQNEIFNPEDFADEANAFAEPKVLTEDQVTFIGDKSEFLKPEEAIAVIEPIADYLVKHPDVKLLLVGSTAGDITNESTLKLSEERAAAVKGVMVDFGVDESRIAVLGLASSDPWHIPNAGYEGPLAASNRKVTMVDASTEIAKELMK